MPNDDWVFWLNLTNIALGVVVLLAVLVVAYGLVWEFLSRYKKPRTVANLDEELKAMLRDEFAHSLSVPGLGVTMADGGERDKPLPEQPAEKKRS
jgi:O-antigen/teichoic acid export membrane protein